MDLLCSHLLDACLSAQHNSSQNQLNKYQPNNAINSQQSQSAVYEQHIRSPISSGTESTLHSFANTTTDLDLDHDSITSNCSDISTGALQNIRNRMVSSLRLISDLEEQVQTVPELRKQVNELRNDNNYLTGLIKRNEENKIRSASDDPAPDVNKRKGPAPQPPQRRSVSVSLSVPTEDILVPETNRESPVPSKRLTRSPIVTRDVGVTTHKASTQSIGTNSEARLYTAEELDSIVQQVIAKQKKTRANRCVNSSTQLGTSTFLTKPSRSTSVQTKPRSNSVATMTLLETPSFTKSPCLKCKEQKQFDSTCLPAPVISLEFMDILPQSKKTSSNQSNQTPIVTKQNVAIQATVPIKSHCSKASQSSPTVGIHFGCQHTPQLPVLQHKLTETNDLLVHYHKASGPDTMINRPRVIDKSTNTLRQPQTNQATTSTTELTKLCDVGSSTDTITYPSDTSQIQFHCPNGCPKDSVYCEACKHAIRSISREIGLNFTTSLQKSGSSHSLSGSSPVSEYSRIPRPTTLMSPRPERRFDRQTTYSVTNKATTPTRGGRLTEEDFVKTCPAEEILR